MPISAAGSDVNHADLFAVLAADRGTHEFAGASSQGHDDL